MCRIICMTFFGLLTTFSLNWFHLWFEFCKFGLERLYSNKNNFEKSLLLGWSQAFKRQCTYIYLSIQSLDSVLDGLSIPNRDVHSQTVEYRIVCFRVAGATFHVWSFFMCFGLPFVRKVYEFSTLFYLHWVDERRTIKIIHKRINYVWILCLNNWLWIRITMLCRG